MRRYLVLILLAGCQSPAARIDAGGAVESRVESAAVKLEAAIGKALELTTLAQAQLAAQVEVTAGLRASVAATANLTSEIRAATSQAASPTAGRDSTTTQNNQSGGVSIRVDPGQTAGVFGGIAAAGTVLGGYGVWRARRNRRALRSVVKGVEAAGTTETKRAIRAIATRDGTEPIVAVEAAKMITRNGGGVCVNGSV